MSYACTSCGYATARWLGFCPQCRKSGALADRTAQRGRPVPVRVATADGPAPRLPVGLAEVDRVLGGGLVDGSVILLGGEPGVGKSTLLLQISAACADTGSVLYVSGEESAAQVGLRASRIDADADQVLVLAETDLAVIEAAVIEVRPSLVVIDSIQTTRSSDVDGSSGGVTQVRECGARLSALARDTGVPVVLVGHVTKDGVLAGPRVLEHIVDAVLYLEGDPTRGLRYLRSIKNRYGSIDQVGVFEMTDHGLDEVADPTGLFVDGWTGGVPGTVVFPALYGRRSLLVEVQALVASNPAPQPRRSVKGVEAPRVHQILAVLDRHADVSCAEHDVYVNVVGGLTLRDPAADLAVALAIASSRVEVALGSLAAYGEIGLAGEVRAASQANRRGSEVQRFGIQRVVTGGEVDRIGDALVAAGITMARSVRLAAPA